MPDTFELASPEWFAAIAESLHRAAEGLDLGGASVTISEEFTDPPAHLLPPGARSIGWHFTMTDGAVVIGAGPREDADLVTVVDYATCVPAARQAYSADPAVMAETARHREEAAAAGKMRRTGDEAMLPPALLARLMVVHNELAARTA